MHSVRVAGDREALVARVRTKDGALGYGFTLNDDAGMARDMAAWDALSRAKAVPLFALLGGRHRTAVKVEEDGNPAIAPDWTALRKGILQNRFDLLRIDPFAWGSVEQVCTIAAAANAFDLGIALLAPNGHPWELQYCAALAATVRGDDTRVIVRSSSGGKAIGIKANAGVGVDWSIEPAFDRIQWQG